jgi:hypothetical protein
MAGLWSAAFVPATWRAGLWPAALVPARIVGDSNAARKELRPFEAGTVSWHSKLAHRLGLACGMVILKFLKGSTVLDIQLFHALKSVCRLRVIHRGLRCGIDFGIPSLRPLWITLLLALSLGRWALSTSTETLNLNLSTFTNA